MNYDKIEHYSYGKLIFELIKLAELHKFEVKLIGQEKFKKINAVYPIYRITTNPEAKIKFCIATGMHGDEIAGPLSIYYLLKNPKKYFDPKICYYIYPTISPTAFDLRRRFDDDNKELNTLSKTTLRNRSYHEIKCYFNDFKKLKIDAFLSIHEDVIQKKFYAYVNSNNQEVYKQIMENGKKHFGIIERKNIYGCFSNQNGIVIGSHDRSTENWIFTHKKPFICLTTETPAQGINLNHRIETNLKNIQILNKYIIKNIKL